jgi:hypothetical protein
MVLIKPVEVLGCPVGNMWDVFWDDKWKCRVTYEGNTLVKIKGSMNKGERDAINYAIEGYYS